MGSSMHARMKLLNRASVFSAFVIAIVVIVASCRAFSAPPILVKPPEVVLLGDETFVPVSNTIGRLRFSADGAWIAASSSHFYGTVNPGFELWNLKRKARQDLGQLGTRDVMDFAWAPRTHRVAVCVTPVDGQSSVEIWNLETVKVERTLARSRTRFSTVDWSPDGKWICAGQDKGSLTVWSAEDGQRVQRQNAPTARVQFSPDSQSLAAADADGVRLIGLKDWKQASSVAAEVRAHNDIAFGPDGDWIAIGTSDAVLIWELESGKLRTLFRDEAVSTFNLAVSPDGRRLVSVGASDYGRCLDVESGEEVYRVRIQEFPCDISKDGKTLVFVRGQICFADAATGRLREHAGTHLAGIRTLVASSNRESVLSQSLDGELRLWHLERKTLERTITDNAGLGTTALAVDAQKFVYREAEDTWLSLQTVSEGPEDVIRLKLPRGTIDDVSSISLSPDAEQLAVSFLSGRVDILDVDSMKVLWNVREDAQEKATLEKLVLFGDQVQFTADGKRLAVISTKTGKASFYDVEKKRALAEVGPGGDILLFMPIGISADGMRALVLGNRSMDLVSTTDGRLIQKLEINHLVSAAALSPDGKLAAVAICLEDSRHAVRVWRLSDRAHRTFETNSGFVQTMSFTSDSRKLMTGGGNSLIHVWEVGSLVR